MISNTDVKRVKALQNEIVQAKQELAECVGQEKELMNQLKEEFDVSTLNEAKELLSDMEKKEKDMESEISAGIKKLEEEYDF